VPGEGTIGALIRTVSMDLLGPKENPNQQSCDGGFLQYLREQLRSFHDLLRQKPSSLFILSELNPISVTCLKIQSTHLYLVERMVV
jgi:hypothetical protein